MGALDVCPFIPVRGVTMDECVLCAQAFGQRLAEELGVPGECRVGSSWVGGWVSTWETQPEPFCSEETQASALSVLPDNGGLGPPIWPGAHWGLIRGLLGASWRGPSSQ